MEAAMPHNMTQFTVDAAFRFVVNVDGIDFGAFTECTLPTLEWEVEEVKEGGQNTYIHQLPGRRKSAKVTLKNGVGNADLMMDWYSSQLEGKFKRHEVTITLYNSMLVPKMVLAIHGAYPSKWTGPNLKSDDNTIAIQTLEMTCSSITLAAK